MFRLKRFRYVIATLILCSTLSCYVGRINLSTAIEEMVLPNSNSNNAKSIVPTDACPVKHLKVNSDKWSKLNSTTTNHAAQKFDWNEKTQGLILGAFFWGYFLFQVPGGRMSDTIGPRLLTTIGIVTTGIINLLTPMMAPHFYIFVGSRVVLGAVQAMVFPCAYSLASRWIPQEERSTVLAMASIGSAVGSIITSSLSGYLSKHGFAGGWPSVFYVSGIICIVIGILYFLVVANDPKDHRLVTADELNYITGHLSSLKSDNAKQNYVTEKTSFPWMYVVTTVPVLAYVFHKIASTWCYSLVILKAPAYMDHVLRLPIEQNGYYSSVMFAAFVLINLIGGLTADSIIKRQMFKSKTSVRKIFQSISTFGTAAFLVLIPLLTNCNQILFLLIMICVEATLGFQAGGEVAIPSDMSNEYSATIFSIGNMFGMSTAFIGPYLTGVVLDMDPTMPRRQWSYIIYSTAAFNCLGGLVFVLFASAEPQRWGESAKGNVNVEKHLKI